jgi:hypothetical protein
MAVEILAFLPGLLLLWLANYTENRKDLRILTQVFLGISVALLILFSALIVVTSGSEAMKGYNAAAYGCGLLLTGFFALLLFLKPVRSALASVMSIEPDNWLHATALIFAILLVGMSLSTALTTDVLKTSGVVSAVDMILQDAVFVMAALLGVGWLTRRDWRKVAERLGLRRPGFKDIGWSLVFFVVVLLAMVVMGRVDDIVNPEKASLGLKDDPTIKLLGGVTVLSAILFALGAGIGEEILFRGAMQPRFGIIITSLVFALIHIQYFDAVSIASLFAVGAILGYERKRTSTTTCVITHSLYDLLLFMSVAV